MKWTTVKAPPDAAVPQPMTVRVQSIPPRHYFPEHFHNWNQMVYAISGVLTVAAEGQSYVISPEQAVWLPTGHRHRVGTLLGAEFRSLWIANDAAKALPSVSTVFGVTPLLKALIIEAAQIEGDNDEDGYRERVTELILINSVAHQRYLARCLGRSMGHVSCRFVRRFTPTPLTRVDPMRGGGNLACRNAHSHAVSKRKWT